MFIFKYAFNDKNFFTTKMSVRVEVSAGRPAHQSRMAAAKTGKRHHFEPGDQALMPLSRLGVDDHTIIVCGIQMPEFDEQCAT